VGLGDGQRVGLFLATFFAAGAITTAYLPVWFADQGLTSAEIGQVLGLGSLLRVLTVPGWGWLADAVGRRRAVLFGGAALAASAAALLPTAQGFLAILLVVAVQGVAASALTPLSDALTLALAAVRRLDYGRTRAYGSVAYMVATALGGVLLGRLGNGMVPWMVAGFYALTCALTPALPGVIAPAAAVRLQQGPLFNRSFRLALVAMALVQGAHAAYYGFATLHWRSAGIQDGAIGLLIAEGIVAEVALFIWGRRLVERLGPARLTAVAAAASIVRWTATAFVTDVPALAVVQLLHAGTFACQHLSTMLVLRTMPAHRAGTAQALMSALGFSAPTGLLIWFSGQIYGEAGGLTFLVMAVIGGSALLLVPALARTFPRPGPHPGPRAAAHRP